MALKPQTETYDDFGDGIDRRAGILSRSTRKFYELDNYVVTSGRKLKMRPPLLLREGAIDTTNSQGCEYLNGRIVTVGKLDTPATHTIAGVDTLYFDNPEGATAWELLEMVTYNEVVCALIRHTFPASVACPRRNFLHVFDGERATYVTDPAFPQSWAPNFPTQPYGAGTRGAYRDYVPRLSVIGDRLSMTTASGDTALCAVGLPRVWNTLAPSEILANGEMFYHILPAPGNGPVYIHAFTVPVTYDDLRYTQRYAAYVCEYLRADGVWVQFTEVASPTNVGEYNISTTTNRFDATKPNETTILIRSWDEAPDGTLVRFRAIPDPPMTIVSGVYLTATVIPGQIVVAGGNAIGGTIVHEGKSYNLQSTPIGTFPVADTLVDIVMSVPSAPVVVPIQVGAPVSVDGDELISPLNGQQRYWTRIIAEVKSNSVHNLITGGVYLVRYGSAWYLFDAERTPPDYPGFNLSVGSVIQVGSDTFTILSLSENPNGSFSGNPNQWRGMRVAAGGPVTIAYTTGSLPVFGAGGAIIANMTLPLGTAHPWYDSIYNGGYTYAIDGTNDTDVGGTVIRGTNTKYTTQLVVGRSVDLSGEKRKVISISSDVRVEVELPFTIANTGAIALRDPTYEYAADIGDTGNEWYATKEAEITLKRSGKDDALVLGTSNYDASGDLPVALAAMDNRMIVQYPSSMQSWAVGPSVADFRRLATVGVGAGSINTRPQPVLADARAGLPTVNGPRLFDVTTDGKDIVGFVSVGDMLRGITLPNLDRSVWWPRMRAWISCASSGDNGRMFVLSMHHDTKVLAWSTWTPTGVTVFDKLFVQDDQLVVKSGASLHYFDPDATVFTDAGGQYTSRARWLYNDLGSPKNKKLMLCEIVQKGRCTVSIHVNPRSLDPVAPPKAGDGVVGPVCRGVTVGLQRLQIMAMGPGIALEIESSDPVGHELDSVGFDYTLLNR